MYSSVYSRDFVLGEVVRTRSGELFCMYPRETDRGILLERPRRVILFCNDFSENVPHSDDMQFGTHAAVLVHKTRTVLRARTLQSTTTVLFNNSTVQYSSKCSMMVVYS